ncbi:hypothetical protein PHLCEN_2v2082 [Hermanssonia centrifuga]|uniref:Uncharacterized protein n=1 Tax=Hermanssonia centrifuga TaxID=98765 RepID=A0A2R6RQ72_9APHY|nr:hypothetical protein PHLCEN_2v2082 [Hermanssonia centrifuga]
MDIDSAEKSKGKGKNKDKQVATATADKKKFCHICKKMSHNTDDCYQLAKNPDKKPKAKYQSMDNEDEAPQSSTFVSSARIEELEDADETALVGKDEAQSHSDKVQPCAILDFWKTYM